jgi:hypothetical protein
MAFQQVDVCALLCWLLVFTKSLTGIYDVSPDFHNTEEIIHMSASASASLESTSLHITSLLSNISTSKAPYKHRMSAVVCFLLTVGI